MILFGRNVCTETIRSKLEYEKVVVKESFKDSILDYMKKNKIRYDILPDNVFNNKYPNSQGIIIDMKVYKYADFNECLKSTTNNSLVLILDSIEDPQNFGNMIRTFEALGGSFIIVPKNRSVEVTPTVAKVSAGAFANVNIVQVSNINNAISKLKDNGYWVMGTDMKGDTTYDNVRVDMPIALIIGSEGFGMSKLVRDNCDYLLQIPMVGKINSLNASITFAICMSNIVSRRNKL